MGTGFQYVEGMFKNNTGLVAKAMEGVLPEQWLLKPGDGSNHLMWVVGHLIWGRDNLLKTLGAEASIPWAPQFGRGSKAESISQVPRPEDVQKAWTEVAARLADSLAAVPAEALAKPHDKPTFDGQVGGFIAFLAFHETYHVGQVGYLRKWLGHGQLVG